MCTEEREIEEDSTKGEYKRNVGGWMELMGKRRGGEGVIVNTK